MQATQFISSFSVRAAQASYAQEYLVPNYRGCSPRYQVCPLSQVFSSTRGETYWTVTFTTVDTVVVPDVPVTVIAAAPFGVPGEPELEVDVYALQPAITNVSANNARYMLNAKRRRGVCRNLTKPATQKAESMAESSRSPSGPGPLSGRCGGKFELPMVERVILIAVPLGPGVTGF